MGGGEGGGGGGGEEAGRGQASRLRLLLGIRWASIGSISGSRGWLWELPCLLLVGALPAPGRSPFEFRV